MRLIPAQLDHCVAPVKQTPLCLGKANCMFGLDLKNYGF